MGEDVVVDKALVHVHPLIVDVGQGKFLEQFLISARGTASFPPDYL